MGFMSATRSICVYCGSSPGRDQTYMAAGRALGSAMAQAGIRLVYGGGSKGIMGAVSLAALEAGGKVTGIIPQFLKDREVMLGEASELVVTADMHERKRIMFERADAFVALPGGIGTYDEVLEVIAWRQLRQLRQPIGLLDVGGYFQPWLRLLEHTVERDFASAGDIDHLLVETDPVLLVDRLHEALLA